VKPAVKTVSAKTALKPAAKPAAKTTVKPAVKSAAKPGPKVLAKPELKAAAKPEAKKKPVKAAAPVVQPKPVKVKAKLVRDSFTMPRADFALIDSMKERALAFKRPAKKSELLRAGLQALSALSDTQFKAALEALTPLKPGRPKQGE
jgi:hypothetical protein